MRFWGWGEDGHEGGLSEEAAGLLARELGLPPGAPRSSRAVGLDEVRVGPSTLPEAAREALAQVAVVRDDHEARVLHAAGKSYPDLVRMRSGDASSAPDAVVAPRQAGDVAAVLEVCASHGVAVVPFGGGTSVVGGVEPLRGPLDAVISLDLGSLDEVLRVDERSLTADVEPGLRLPELEARLAPHGLTLGHVPQSYEYASVGGCVATRSAGQASTGYGRIDDLVTGVRLVAPAGELSLQSGPATAAGPDLRELVVGSEGALGVITSASLRLARAPQARRYEGFAFRSFEQGVDALRVLAQAGQAPDVARLSDEEETRLQLALAGSEGVRGAVAGAYLRARGVGGGCIAICGWEGDEHQVAGRRVDSADLLRRAGAVRLGQSPGRAWVRSRFHGPYHRDELMDRGVLVETVETAALWSGLADVHRAVGAALRTALAARGTPPLVMCHVSHLYPTGASLYFTCLARAQPGEELEQWRAAKHAATDAIVASGGTLTHHHAVGRDHAPWLPAEIGEVGVAALRAVKRELDPEGIMNPGKLLP
jgi:alkyldihydroxyacetonephosphate synthase